MNVTVPSLSPVAVPTFDLDSLLADSMKSKEEAAQVKRMRTTLATQHLSKEERAELKSTVANWETKREWLAKASVLVFSTQLPVTELAMLRNRSGLG